MFLWSLYSSQSILFILLLAGGVMTAMYSSVNNNAAVDHHARLFSHNQLQLINC